MVDEIHHAAGHVERVSEIMDVKVRWLGHRMHVELNITVDASLSVEKGHEIAAELRHELLHHLTLVQTLTNLHTASGEFFYQHRGIFPGEIRFSFPICQKPGFSVRSEMKL